MDFFVLVIQNNYQQNTNTNAVIYIYIYAIYYLFKVIQEICNLINVKYSPQKTYIQR